MVVMVVVVVVVFMVMVVLVALDHRNHKPRAAGRAGRLLPLQAGQHGGHRRLLLLLLGVGLRGQRGFRWGHGVSGLRPQPFAVAVLQRVLVVGGRLGLVWQVVHILPAVSGRSAGVQHGLQRRVVAVTFSGFASAAPGVPSASLVGSLW